MCTGLSANILENDSIPEDVFGTDHCPGTDAPHVNDDLLITTTSRHEYSISVTVIVYDAASVRALAGALATSEQGSEGALAVFNISMPAGEEYVPSSVERKVYGVDDDAWHGAAVVYLDAITGNMTMTIAPDPLIAYSRLNCSTSQAQECASKCEGPIECLQSEYANASAASSDTCDDIAQGECVTLRRPVLLWLLQHHIRAVRVMLSIHGIQP